MTSELLQATEERNKKERKKSQIGVLINPLKYGVKDCLNDTLLLNVVQLYSKLIRFNMLKHTGRQSLLYQVVNTFTKILEYDHKYPAYGYLLAKLRSNPMNSINS